MQITAKNRSSDLPSLYVSQRPILPNQSLQTDYLVQPLNQKTSPRGLSTVIKICGKKWTRAQES